MARAFSEKLNMSVFDPKLFQQMTFTAENSTKTTPIPVGEYEFELY